MPLFLLFVVIIGGILYAMKNNVLFLNSTEDILARTAWGEARSEGAQGMQAVMNVVMNRYNDPRTWWGRSIKDIPDYPVSSALIKG